MAKRLGCWTGLPPSGRDYQALYVYFSHCEALLDSNRSSAICILLLSLLLLFLLKYSLDCIEK